MPVGTVRDDGDEGMRGQRIGWLVEMDAEGNEKGDLLPFNNGRFRNNHFYPEGCEVNFRLVTRKSPNLRKYAQVISYCT